MPDAHDALRDQKIIDSFEFQDFVAEMMYRYGLPLVNYQSVKYQRRGENMAGFEIKNDKRFAETRNLYIEIAEKPHPDKPEFWPSGIYREDRTWMWIIGDLKTLFIIPKNTLLRMHALNVAALRDGKPLRYEEREIETSRGFLLPEKEARVVAAKVIEVPDER